MQPLFYQALVITSFRFRFDGHSTAFQKRSQWENSSLKTWSGGDTGVDVPSTKFMIVMPPPRYSGGIKRCFCLTSVAYIGNNSRTQRPRKTKIVTQVAHVTCDSDTTFKVKDQGHQAGLFTEAFAHRQLQRSAWERIERGKLLLRCRLQVRRGEALQRAPGAVPRGVRGAAAPVKFLHPPVAP